VARVSPKRAETSKLPYWLRDVPYEGIEDAWAKAIPDPDDHATIRRVCFVDRFYLMVRLLNWQHMLHPFLYLRTREVERATDGHLDLWGRGHGKSSVITIAGAIQEIIRNPEVTIGVFSHSASIAKGSFLSPIKRELEANSHLQELFPHIFWQHPQEEAPSWSLDGGLIVKRRGNPKECTVSAHGIVDGQPTSKHFQLMVFDDVVVESSVNTPEQIEKTTLAFSLADNLGSRGARKQSCGTRYHHADTYQDQIERGSVKLRVYPATHDGTLDGIPVYFTADEWTEKKKTQLPSTVACQLLLNPQAAGTRMFELPAISRWEVRPRRLTIYILVDPAHSMKKDSDHTAMAVVGLDRQWNRYFLDGVSHHMLLHDRWCWMRDLRERWSREPGVVSVKVGYEKIGAYSDLQYFQQQMEIEGVAFEIEELGWPRSGGGSKVDRVQRLAPDFQTDKFHLPYRSRDGALTKNQKRVKEQGEEYLIAKPIKAIDENGSLYDVLERLERQIADFPYCGRKDLIDALSRVYDCDPRIPIVYDSADLEPEVL
jgi:hypothetical protein